MEIQRPARMRPQGRVEGGRSHGGEGLDDTLGTTDGDGAEGKGAQDGAEQMESQGDTEDPEGRGGGGDSE